MKLTRSQALEQAIIILKSQKDDYSEITELLSEIKEEIAIKRWTDKSIHDAVEQFIADNGRIPKATDFRKSGMPPHTVIKNKYKKTLSEWLKENYPDKQSNLKKYTEDFINDYMKIKPKSQYEFNKKRNTGTKTWQTIAGYYRLTSWTALIKNLDLPKYNKEKTRLNFEGNVHVYHDIETFVQHKKK